MRDKFEIQARIIQLETSMKNCKIQEELIYRELKKALEWVLE
jgi:hypothetical protein